MMPKPTVVSLHWSKRVALEKVKRLYASDARGVLDEALLDDVGHGLYARCADIFEHWTAREGNVTCRNCGRMIKRRRHDDKTEWIKCRCGWQLTWGDYLRKSEGHQLGASDVHLLVAHFIQQWPRSKTAADKMLLIDWIIHQFHVKMTGMGSTFGTNMLAGNTSEVFDFLDTLAYGSTQSHHAAMRETRATWQQARATCWVSKPALATAAKRLGIKGYSTMDYEALVEAVLRVAPNQFDDVDARLESLTRGLRGRTIADMQTRAKR